MFLRSSHAPERIRPGYSKLPPLAPERIDLARERFGGAVDQYVENLNVGDPLADDLVRCFDEMPPNEGPRMLALAIRQGIDAIDEPPEPLVAIFKELDHVPFWVDWDLMAVASRKIVPSGLLTTLSFAAYALPHSYLATGNRPLSFTSTLLDDSPRRYAQTLHFVVESFLPGGLQRHADGFSMAVWVRMLHARARREILQSGEWDEDPAQIPLNQAHSAVGTILFSFYVVEGMRRLGVRFSRREVEGVLMTWRYIGYLLGVNPELVYTSEEQAHRILDIAFSLEFDPDEVSKQLCQALIDAGPEVMQIKRNARQSKIFLSMANPMTRYLLGDRLADQLGYPPEKRLLLCRAFVALVWLSERVPWLIPRVVRDYKGVAFWLEKGAQGMDGSWFDWSADPPPLRGTGDNSHAQAVAKEVSDHRV